MKALPITGWLGLCALVISLAGVPGQIQADETVRYGLFVGQNDGGRGTRPLLYAESDATRVREVLTRIGSLSPKNAVLLKNTRRSQVMASLGSLTSAIRQDQKAGRRTMLTVYYSGHADAGGWRLGSDVLGHTEIKQVLKQSSADLRLLVIDACFSGEAIRLKGGTRAPAFLVQVDDGDTLTGDVVISSSASDEVSQESDRIGGGYFTHHLLSGLIGGADASRDGEVTLEEAYAYAYHRTLMETAGSASGLQHPGIQSDLRGHGTLPLTQPAGNQTLLVFPPGIEGQFLVFDRARMLFVAELNLSGPDPHRLALPSGKYLIQKREQDYLLVSEVQLTRGATRQIEVETMTRAPFDQDFSKGVQEANLRRAIRQPVRLTATGGYQAYIHQPEGDILFPAMPMAGVEAEWSNRLGPGWSLTSDFLVGVVGVPLELEALPYAVPTVYQQVMLGLGVRYGRSLGRWTLAVGPHLAGVYLRRSFPGTQEPFQDFVNIAPGGVGTVDLEVTPRIRVGVAGRSHFLYHTVDDEDRSVGYLEGLIRVSLTF